MQWKIYKFFPQLLPFRSIDDLTAEQYLELISHVILDDGASLCKKCGNINKGAFCSKCGKESKETIQCFECKEFSLVSEEIIYCIYCGTIIGQTDIEKAMESGELQPEDIKIKPMDEELVKGIFDKILIDNDEEMF